MLRHPVQMRDHNFIILEFSLNECLTSFFCVCDFVATKCTPSIVVLPFVLVIDF